MPLSCQDLNSKRKFLPRYKKLYLKSEFNFNISNISQQGYFTDTQSERLYKYIFFLSFFLLILARSNYDHYARECNFGILKTKQKKKKKNLSAVFLTK